MVLIHEDKEYLKYCRDEIAKELEKLSLELHSGKTQIVRLDKGISFLGFTWRLTESGKVLQSPKKQNVRNFRYILKKLMKKYAKNERSKFAIESSK